MLYDNGVTMPLKMTGGRASFLSPLFMMSTGSAFPGRRRQTGAAPIYYCMEVEVRDTLPSPCSNSARFADDPCWVNGRIR